MAQPEKVNPPPNDGWWIEEIVRGDKEMLVIYKNTEPKGYIEVDSYQDKLAWLSVLPMVRAFR